MHGLAVTYFGSVVINFSDLYKVKTAISYESNDVKLIEEAISAHFHHEKMTNHFASPRGYKLRKQPFGFTLFLNLTE